MNSSALFLPEILIIASIMAIPALYILTENNKSFSMCSNLTLGSSFLFLVLSWYYPDSLSMDREAVSYTHLTLPTIA